jgi:hypothetical protein
MPLKSNRRADKIFLTIFLSLLGLCLLLSVISAISNIGLPQPENSDHLSNVDQARLAEALHFKTELGDRVWPGWGDTQIPVIVWNHAYEFLVGYPAQPPAGWEIVPQDQFNNQVYYRRPAADPQNFAVPVGDQWAASMATKTEADAFLIATFRDLFPAPLKQVFPYRVIIQPSETQIGGILHEDFHVFQQDSAPDRLAHAEAVHRYGDQYQSAAEAFRAELKQEGGLLAQALEAESDEKAAILVEQFLQVREHRRQTYQLSPILTSYERWLEWEEGTAKYVEVASLRQAFESTMYAPLPSMADDPYFKSYRRFHSRWTQELIQLRNPTGSGETRFYNMGMAESFLLDRLLPDWKSQVMTEDLFLEDLLRQAIPEK